MGYWRSIKSSGKKSTMLTDAEYQIEDVSSPSKRPAYSIRSAKRVPPFISRHLHPHPGEFIPKKQTTDCDYRLGVRPTLLFLIVNQCDSDRVGRRQGLLLIPIGIPVSRMCRFSVVETFQRQRCQKSRNRGTRRGSVSLVQSLAS